MATRSHTISGLAGELQRIVDSSDTETGGTAAVRIVFDQRFVDHLQSVLGKGEDSVDLLPLSIESAALYTVVVADAREGAQVVPPPSPIKDPDAN